MIACDLKEDEMSVISRFETGLREEIRMELDLRDITSLEEAIKVARRLDICMDAWMHGLMYACMHVCM